MFVFFAMQRYEKYGKKQQDVWDKHRTDKLTKEDHFTNYFPIFESLKIIFQTDNESTPPIICIHSFNRSRFIDGPIG